MAKIVAFLRAINVGGHTVKMDVLRGLFTQMGFTQVSTFIASGNVIFETPRSDLAGLEAQIEAHLAANLGYPVATFLRGAADLVEVAAFTAFPAVDVEAEGFRVHAGFLKTEPDEQAIARVLALCSEVDEFTIHGRELYWLCRVRVSDSLVSGAALEKALQSPATLRNMTTVGKIANLVRGG